METLSVHLAIIPCRDISSLSRHELSSFSVATSILCRDIIYVVLNVCLATDHKDVVTHLKHLSCKVVATLLIRS